MYSLLAYCCGKVLAVLYIRKYPYCHTNTILQYRSKFSTCYAKAVLLNSPWWEPNFVARSGFGQGHRCHSSSVSGKKCQLCTAKGSLWPSRSTADGSLFHACGPRSHRVSSHSVSPPKHQTCRQRGLLDAIVHHKPGYTLNMAFCG